ncbi:helix-turn-helix domain-containing protein [Streptococcus pseudoporcinus]|uniref:DNA-binding protein n=1 Tax=Streptococcus pseudoporcinus TaxID=361101 RepID=A0A4U9YAA1_9STRE|nr:helix-turn-helix transcriptional regulator [Streptococcus pseudoporcinus]VTS23098.1 DNA-binding protein [Streptococcus pseudoporcinus]VUC70561.1 DNA-binding protein [Streptococcus pseudoporcinus]VUD00390.1 DNA-binding protein [Streptococcus pseudoporcinus]VUD00767.1 DNA-binding protein [Streptococcus pseudoporcinus]
MPTQKSYFPSNLKYLRLEKKMEQLELAHKIGRKSASTISEWENGKYTPKQDILLKVADLFQVDINTLVYVDLTNKGNYHYSQVNNNDISYISEHLDPKLMEEWIHLGKHLLEEQNKKTTDD